MITSQFTESIPILLTTALVHCQSLFEDWIIGSQKQSSLIA